MANYDERGRIAALILRVSSCTTTILPPHLNRGSARFSPIPRATGIPAKATLCDETGIPFAWFQITGIVVQARTKRAAIVKLTEAYCRSHQKDIRRMVGTRTGCWIHVETIGVQVDEGWLR